MAAIRKRQIVHHHRGMRSRPLAHYSTQHAGMELSVYRVSHVSTENRESGKLTTESDMEQSSSNSPTTFCNYNIVVCSHAVSLHVPPAGERSKYIHVATQCTFWMIVIIVIWKLTAEFLILADYEYDHPWCVLLAYYCMPVHDIGFALPCNCIP